MATAYDGVRTGPAFNITSGDDSTILRLSDVSPNHNETGGVALHFVTDGDWSGTITVVCRSAVIDAETLDLPFLGPWPFRAFYLNGSASSGAIVSGGSAAITSTSSIVVPSSGFMLGLSVAASAGTCQVYYQPVAGGTEP